MRRYLYPTVACLAAAAVAVPAFAKPPQQSGGSTSGSSISIATVNGTSTNFASPSTMTVKFGASMTFATTVQSLAGWQYPMVALTCYQDLNGDGYVDMSNTSNEIVFSQLESPGSTFSVGNQASIWGANGGGSAQCRADLDSYGFKSGVESVQTLATTGSWNAS